MYSCKLIIVKLTKKDIHVSADSILCNVGYCLLLFHAHPHVAELAEVNRMYERKDFEVDKLKQNAEESQTSVAKVCSLLVVLF